MPKSGAQLNFRQGALHFCDAVIRVEVSLILQALQVY
jgi:hypothetical protein